jgi:hypothetical protein
MTEPATLSADEQQAHVDPAVVARVRRFCMALPGTTEKEAWGDPSWWTHGRMYAILKFGRGTNLWMAAPDGAQESLVTNDSSRFFRPSNHPLHDGWVGIHLGAPAVVDWGEIEFLLAQAHDVTRVRAAAKRRRTA